MVYAMPIFYEWYVLDRAGRETKRKLSWRMTQEDAVSWAAVNPGKPLEVVPSSERIAARRPAHTSVGARPGSRGKPTTPMDGQYENLASDE